MVCLTKFPLYPTLDPCSNHSKSPKVFLSHWAIPLLGNFLFIGILSAGNTPSSSLSNSFVWLTLFGNLGLNPHVTLDRKISLILQRKTSIMLLFSLPVTLL